MSMPKTRKMLSDWEAPYIQPLVKLIKTQGKPTLALIFIKNKLLNRHLDLRIRLFSVLAIVGTIISLLAAVSVIFTKLGMENFLLNLLSAGLSCGLLVYSYRTGKYRLCYLITIVIVFMILFPAMFFSSGGYHSGMPSFFVFAIVFTVFMLEGKMALIMSALEIIIYVGICVFAYFNPDTVSFFQTETDVLLDIIIAFAAVGVSLGITMYLQFRMYNVQRRELEQAKEEALALNEVKTTFLANMSHEIRTPINVILGMNEMILRESQPEQIARYGANIQNAGKTLLTLISNILDVSKIESGKLELIKESYKTSQLISDLSMIGHERAAKHGITFTTEADETLPSVLYGDFIHIKQVVVNFLSNAVKYTEEGSVTLSFSQKNADDQMILRIIVKDTGIGIDKNNLKYLFQAFTRGNLPSHRNIEGTGLGLAIAKELTELMNGKIYVDSVLGVGSTFMVEIPQRIENSTPIGKWECAESTVRPDESRFVAPTGNILMVDDNKENLEVIKLLLKRSLLQIDTAASGSECLLAAGSKQYNIIFMDYMMPGMDGIETLKQLRTSGVNTPVVALTANAVAGAREMFLTSGFAAYLSKPVMWRELEDVIIKLLPKEFVRLNTKDPIMNAEIIENLRKRLLNYDISIDEGLKYVSGDLAQYKALTDIFTEYFDESRTEIETLFMAKDFDNLTYSIHSLKSKALAVGAVELSEIAVKMEKHLRRDDGAYAEAALSLLMFEWRRVVAGFLEVEI